MQQNQMTDYQVVISTQSIINKWVLGFPMALNFLALFFAQTLLPQLVQIHLGIVLLGCVIALC